jgi:hypothetical protein
MRQNLLSKIYLPVKEESGVYKVHMWFRILVCVEEMTSRCNEAEDFSPLGLYISILDGAHNFKGVLVNFTVDAYYFQFDCSYVFCMEKMLSPSSSYGFY